jgi:hypothetical protein
MKGIVAKAAVRYVSDMGKDQPQSGLGVRDP